VEADIPRADQDDEVRKAPVKDLDKIKRHRQEMYLEDGSMLPVQPAELRAGLTQGDVDSQLPMAEQK